MDAGTRPGRPDAAAPGARLDGHEGCGGAAVGRRLGAGPLRGRGAGGSGPGPGVGLVGVGGAGLRPGPGRAPRHPFGLYRIRPRSRGARPRAATCSPGPGCAGWRWARARASSQRHWPLLQRARPLPSRRPCRPWPPSSCACRSTEGWRGEVLPPGLDGRRRAASPATRSWTPPSTTGSGWPWRCAGSRSPTSPCATRASTSPTAGTTYDPHPALPLAPGLPHLALPEGTAGPAGSVPGPPADPGRALPRRLPGLRGRLPHRGHHIRKHGPANRSRPLPLLPRLRGGLPRGRHRIHAGTPPRHPHAGGPEPGSGGRSIGWPRPWTAR